jgi:Kef-type K+ transport system membrane component KefB
VLLLSALLNNPFQEFAAILLIAALLGGVATLLRQPLIVAFIAVGIIVGPAGLHVASESEQLELLASVGIAILLFLVGLRLDVSMIRAMGPVALAAGLGQVLFTAVVGFALCWLLGLEWVPALYVAMALTFSSTIIVVKLLSDKREIDALHGKIAVGILIVQDMVIILVMVGLSAFGAGAAEDVEGSPLKLALVVIAKSAVLLTALGLMMKFVLPWLIQLMARHHELLVIFAVAWAVAFSAGAEVAGFSREVGAFLAGMSLASTPFRELIGGRLVTLRDFLLLFFFINLGASIDIEHLGDQVFPAILLSVFVLFCKPLLVLLLTGALGYRARTGFLAGLSLGQISEFSLILAALGVSLGHIDQATMGLITLVGLITIGLSTYLIVYAHPIYEHSAPLLQLFEKRMTTREARDSIAPEKVDAVVIGLGRLGHHLALRLKERGHDVLGIDFDPQVVRDWCKEGRNAQYGDAEDPELAAQLPQARWIVSTIPHRKVNRQLIQSLRGRDFEGRVVVTAHSHHDARLLELAGADLVLLPFVDAAAEAADLIVGADKRKEPASSA